MQCGGQGGASSVALTWRTAGEVLRNRQPGALPAAGGPGSTSSPGCPCSGQLPPASAPGASPSRPAAACAQLCTRSPSRRAPPPRAWAPGWPSPAAAPRTGSSGPAPSSSTSVRRAGAAPMQPSTQPPNTSSPCAVWAAQRARPLLGCPSSLGGALQARLGRCRRCTHASSCSCSPTPPSTSSQRPATTAQAARWRGGGRNAPPLGSAAAGYAAGGGAAADCASTAAWHVKGQAKAKAASSKPAC
jgi:hypothetical protein